IPQILAGAEPVATSVLASFFILFITTYISHGVSKQTTVAFLSTCVGLLLAIVFSFSAIVFTGITGYGTNDAVDMHFLTPFLLNVKGLFLAGIIITTLGALNDVTVTQATAVFQLAKQKEKLSFLALAKQGIVIGREHAISLINTLVLAYTGGSLSVIIYFLVTQKQQPVWSIIGNEFLAEEVIRTIGGTMGLVLAVPLATYFAAYVVTRGNFKKTFLLKK
ncbi:MAG TPA: YibE/F family protein, partial [Methylomirabilota bacterium]|nr:YibE/F family protein [Methylomirabilota bacterium]